MPVWAGLSPFARLVLVQMSTRAYDEAHGGREGRLYYGGHGFLGVMLLGVGDGDPSWPRAKQRIKRAVRELIEAGAIEVVGQPVNHRRTCYAITTNRARLAVDNPPDELTDPARQGVTHEPLLGVTHEPLLGVTHEPFGGSPMNPLSKEEQRNKGKEARSYDW